MIYFNIFKGITISFSQMPQLKAKCEAMNVVHTKAKFCGMMKGGTSAIRKRLAKFFDFYLIYK